MEPGSNLSRFLNEITDTDNLDCFQGLFGQPAITYRRRNRNNIAGKPGPPAMLQRNRRKERCSWKLDHIYPELTIPRGEIRPHV